MDIKVVTKEGNAKVESYETETNGKIVRKAALARQILRKGGEEVRIIDLKQSRDNPERTVFVFENTPRFQEVFSEVLEENKRARSNDDANLRSELEALKEKLEKFEKIAKLSETVNKGE